MKPKTKDAAYDQKRIEAYDGPVSDSAKRLMREEKRQAKKQASRNRRQAEKRDMLKQLG